METPPRESLRQRRGVSLTAVPNSNGAMLVEETPIPPSKKNIVEEEEETTTTHSKAMSGKAVAKDENRKRKILVRVSSGALMVSHLC